MKCKSRKSLHILQLNNTLLTTLGRKANYRIIRKYFELIWKYNQKINKSAMQLRVDFIGLSALLDGKE